MKHHKPEYEFRAIGIEYVILVLIALLLLASQL